MTPVARTPERETVVIKFVITGPFAAGKTTLVRTMSEILVVETETTVPDETSAVKSNTTVSMDFGELTLLDEDLAVEFSLFGTPGQAASTSCGTCSPRGRTATSSSSTSPAPTPSTRPAASSSTSWDLHGAVRRGRQQGSR